jgi:hypothetical protein
MLFKTLALILAVGFAHPAHAGRPYHHEAKEAMGVAEVETGGEAVSVRRVAMNGTVAHDGKGGFEVLVRMPMAKRGWRCLIDGNTMRLRSRESIPNPGSKVA